MLYTNTGTWNPQIMGYRNTNTPWIDPDGGEILPIFWVECAGCGGEVPTEPGSNGSLPRRLLHIIQVSGGYTYYASPSCVKRAVAILKVYGEVTVITAEPVEFIPLSCHMGKKKQRQAEGDQYGDAGG